MINWKQCVYGDKVRIIDIDGNVFDGIVECVIEAQERSDLQKQEDGICIIADNNRHIDFYESEIQDISALNVSRRQKSGVPLPHAANI